MARSNICSVNELRARLHDDDLRILDCSWYLPSQQVNVEGEYHQQHIPGAAFFHIDLICDQNSDLPHMLPSAEEFSAAVSDLGVSNTNEVVVYDSAGIFSAARVWWMFRIFGHDRVKVLNGGLPAWVAAGGAVSATPNVHTHAEFVSVYRPEFVIAMPELVGNLTSGRYTVLDARSSARFEGRAPEPRPGLPSGHMPHSVSLPFDSLLTEGHLRAPAELQKIFNSHGITAQDSVVTSCGSGVTAAIITLALAQAGFGLQKLYDGSWAEWASSDESVILNSDNSIS